MHMQARVMSESSPIWPRRSCPEARHRRTADSKTLPKPSSQSQAARRRDAADLSPVGHIRVSKPYLVTVEAREGDERALLRLTRTWGWPSGGQTTCQDLGPARLEERMALK